jgi:hypothetical protein
VRSAIHSSCPKNILTYGAGGLDTAAGALTSTANFLQGPWLARRAQDASPARPILELSRHGMLLRSISGPSRLLANRLTEERGHLCEALKELHQKWQNKLTSEPPGQILAISA